MKLTPTRIILIGALIVALTSCTDNGDIDPRDGLATYDTIPRNDIKTIDSSKIIVRR